MGWGQARQVTPDETIETLDALRAENALLRDLVKRATLYHNRPFLSHCQWGLTGLARVSNSEALLIREICDAALAEIANEATK